MFHLLADAAQRTFLETNKAIKIVSDAKIRRAKSGDVHDQPLTD